MTTPVVVTTRTDLQNHDHRLTSHAANQTWLAQSACLDARLSDQVAPRPDRLCDTAMSTSRRRPQTEPQQGAA